MIASSVIVPVASLTARSNSTNVFVRDFLHVPQPFEAVASRLVGDPSWLAPIAEEAASTARAVAWGLSGRDPLPSGPSGVRSELGPPRVRASGLMIPLWFVTPGDDPWLPDLTGDLEVAPVGPERCLLAFAATYRRPARDPQVVERVERATEAGVRALLHGIAAMLARPADSG